MTDLAAVATPILAHGGRLLPAHRLGSLLAPVLYVIAWKADGTAAGRRAPRTR